MKVVFIPHKKAARPPLQDSNLIRSEGLLLVKAQLIQLMQNGG